MHLIRPSGWQPSCTQQDSLTWNRDGSKVTRLVATTKGEVKKRVSFYLDARVGRRDAIRLRVLTLDVSSPTCPAAANCRNGYADGVCQPDCSSPACGLDGGDCVSDDRVESGAVPSSRPALLLLLLLDRRPRVRLRIAVDSLAAFRALERQLLAGKLTDNGLLMSHLVM
ncbi:unnamed protein product [Protopolystoma xenopodis]|uniref:LNR domain-containing protein n=1 Tax=Protopolystoma xenopodis TaxID=117903 RepID=A0A3S5AI57_9PLAT|nr:unnamed protein product [Protopolystoma xenopodis]